MPMGQATTNQQSITYFHLAAHNDLNDCLDACYPIGYTGTSSLRPGGTWLLMMESETQKGIQATIGDVLVWDEIRITIYTLAEFLARYTA